MLVSLTHRGPLGRALAALLGWTGLRPALAPACPHPLHRPLFADRPGAGPWFHTDLWLACPRCQQAVHQRGYLPDGAYAFCTAVSPPDGPANLAPVDRCASFTYGGMEPPADDGTSCTYTESGSADSPWSFAS